MPWTLLDSTSVNFADGNAGHAVSWPGGAPADGGLLILAVNSITTVSTPSGWTPIEADVNQQGAYMWYRVAASEAGSVTVTTNGDHPTDATLLRWSGQGASPLDVHTVARATFDARTFSPAIGPLSLSGSGELVVLAAGGSNNTGGAGTSPVPSTGYSLLGDSGMAGSGSTAVQQFVTGRTDGSGSQAPSVSWSGGTFDHRTSIAAAFSPASATSVAAGQATETDTAQPVGGRKVAAAGQPAETDTAQPVGASKLAAASQAAETDTAQPIGGVKLRAAGQPVETDVAQPIAARKFAAVGRAVEVDAATRLTVVGGAPASTTPVFRGATDRSRDPFRPGPWRG